MQGIINQPTSPWFLGCWDQKGGVCLLIRHFWAQKEKVIGNSQDGFTRAKSCLTSPGASYGKKTGLEEHWMSFALLLARFLTWCQVLSKGRNNAVQWCRTGTARLQSSSAGKDLGVFVDDELIMNQQCAPATESWAVITGASLGDQRSNYTHLSSTF